MCQIITMTYKGKSVDFIPKSECNCCLGNKNSNEINMEFAQWLLKTYQKIREENGVYCPEVIITIF